MSSADTVQNGETVYAMFFRRDMVVDGIKFLTPPTFPMQVGLMEHPAHHAIEPHKHPAHAFNVQTMSEFLYIERGRIKAIVYDEKWNVLAERELGAGDFLLFFCGGHAINVIEDVRMIEVKQGPYPGDEKAKVYREKPAEAITHP
ncbi:hypothetical protein A3D11_03805 [Candidatus Peribacteria bacterium RIFCSPHIGHO2_02_FULL_49_16]|nr:MAG: hypothetical protein A2880_04765 [Candidatus Peribacteria bacterium RIFCSPHIGHO2_01_FULL_49_38]OGJ58858.1 MAG: hypothetical protein A3D11_03805 [Candidatus Peribacteria bacterium RIFCSPHIGHO2_02_FULL_49_16]